MADQQTLIAGIQLAKTLLTHLTSEGALTFARMPFEAIPGIWQAYYEDVRITVQYDIQHDDHLIKADVLAE